MYFNSFTFAVFFPTVFFLYWLFPFRLQNVLLLVASYVFYGFWDWRFLSLIAISTIVDYIAGLKIQQERDFNEDGFEKRAKRWLILSVCTNLGILGFFKYFNFFIGSFSGLLSEFGINVDTWHLNIILPVGISFYTFQTMSYTIDIYRGKMKPTKQLLEFAVYVSFFPQLVAGPIERAKNLLPRIMSKRKFNISQFYEGVHLILIGLFKKVYVADNLAKLVDRIYMLESYSAFDVITGGTAFTFQVYCDFSGYSDIARGCAKCLGIELMLNFNYPFVSVNPSDFWRRWHISLSTWLRDYLYFPLGGNRKGKIRTYINLGLTMLLSGLWHGASWVFVIWGGYCGAAMMVHRMLGSTLETASKILKPVPHPVKYFVKMFCSFQIFCFGLIIFRSQSLQQAYDMNMALFTWQGSADWLQMLPILKFAGPLVLYELIHYAYTKDIWANAQKVPVWIRSVEYAIIVYLFIFYGASAESFVYFQF